LIQIFALQILILQNKVPKPTFINPLKALFKG
jgi:hypothetical protein